jgi:RNA polymerase sigma-70 factor (ECF subfamily)
VQRQTFDSGYLQRLAQADPETERDFTAYFGELLAIKLRPRLRSADLVEDVTQETFLRVIKAIREGNIGNPEALGAFVNSVCNNILFEVYRQQARFGDAPADEAGTGAVVEQSLFAAEESASVRQVLAEMADKDRNILTWLFLEEKEKGEICLLLGVEREYLRVLVHRAKNKFRADWIKRVATKIARSSPMR